MADTQHTTPIATVASPGALAPDWGHAMNAWHLAWKFREAQAAEDEACILYSQAEGTPDQEAADAVTVLAGDRTEAALVELAEWQARTLCDIVVKSAVLIGLIDCGLTAAGEALKASIVADVWRCAPGVGALLRGAAPA